MKKIILKSAGTKENTGKGGGIFYSLLFIAIITVGTTAYVMRTRNEAINKLESQPPKVAATIEEQIPIHVASAPVNIPPSEQAEPVVSEGQWQSDDVIPVEQEDASVTQEAEKQPISSVIKPVQGNILKQHSDTKLAYSKTMEDWRLHKGVDISAPIGTKVIAAADGTVSECYADTACGVTIVIDHGSGVLTRYSNLASAQMVKVGQKINAGDAIAVVGDTAEFEIADEAHLHFEVVKDGRSVDPEEYFK